MSSAGILSLGPIPLPKTHRGKALGVNSRRLLFAQLRNGGIQALLITITLLKLPTALKFTGKWWVASCWRVTVQVKSWKGPKSISNQYLRASKVIIKHQFSEGNIALQMMKDKLFSTKKCVYFPRARKTICYSVGYQVHIRGFMYIVYTLNWNIFNIKSHHALCKSFQFYLNPQQKCLNHLKALNTCSRGICQTNRQQQNPGRVIWPAHTPK